MTAAPTGGLRAPAAVQRQAATPGRAPAHRSGARLQSPPPAPERAEPLLRLLVGATFRRRREQQGRTLAAVATDARVSIAYLSEIERGRKEPSSEVLVAVCRALGMRLADLLAEAAADLRAADATRARRPVAVAPQGSRPTPARVPRDVAAAAPAPTVLEVRSGTERSDRTASDDAARRALLSVA